MNEYRIRWLEHVFFDSTKELYDKQQNLPLTCSLIGTTIDNVAEYDCYDDFDAEDRFDAKRKVRTNYDAEVFNVYELAEGPMLVFTEEDL